MCFIINNVYFCFLSSFTERLKNWIFHVILFCYFSDYIVEISGNDQWTTVQLPKSQVVYTCDRCPRQYLYSENLVRHQRYECGVEPRFPCPHCQYKTKHKNSLILHMRRIHKV